MFGIAVTRSKDTNWCLLKEEDQDLEKHLFVTEKSQRKLLKLYLNEDETEFGFFSTVPSLVDFDCFRRLFEGVRIFIASKHKHFAFKKRLQFKTF